MSIVLKTTKVERNPATLAHVMNDTFADYKRINARTLEISCVPESAVAHDSKWFSLAKAKISELSKARGLTIGTWNEDDSGVPKLTVEFSSPISDSNVAFCSELMVALNNMSEDYNVLEILCTEGDQFGGVLLVKYSTNGYKNIDDKQDGIFILKSSLKELLRTQYRRTNITIGTLPNKSDPTVEVLSVIF